MDSGSSAELYDVTFEDNTARDGAAIMGYYGEVYVEGATFEDNHGTTYGGAVWNYYADMTIVDATFSGNTSGTYGGAMLAIGDTTLESVTFEDNRASQGGAIYTYSSARVEGTDVTFDDNDPDDVRTNQGSGSSYTWDTTLDFVCDGQGCRED